MLGLLRKNVYIVAGILLLSGCAKEPSESEQGSELQLLNATQKVYFPTATPFEGYPDGSLWLISHAAVGSGNTPKDGDYVAFDFTGRYLPGAGGRIFQTTDAATARRLNTFANDTHFAPIFIQDTTPITAALYEALRIMRVGDTLTVMSASWLYNVTSSEMATNGEVALSTNPSIFTIALREIAPDPKERELNMVEKYVDSVNALHPETYVKAKDSAGNELEGFYISYDTVSLSDAVLLDSTARYAVTGDSVHVKYAGYYLQDNFMFDSNIDSMKKKEWAATITAADTTNWSYTYMEDGENSTAIKAFSLAVRSVAPGSRLEVVFTSDYAYGQSGSYSSTSTRPIYAYTPMRFKIFVNKIATN